MGLSAYIKKIEKHLTKENVQPLIVDVQNGDDLSAIITHFNVSGNTFISASQHCKKDEYPNEEALLDALSRQDGVVFVTGLSTFLKLQGKQHLRDFLKNLLTMMPAGRMVILTYQCRKYLNFPDPRLTNRLCFVEGNESAKPSLIFISNSLPLQEGIVSAQGIHSVAGVLEGVSADAVYIITEKQKDNFPLSLYEISNLSKAYDVLIQKDHSTASLAEALGTDAQWSYALAKFQKGASWADVIDINFGNHKTLELAIPNYTSFDANQKWLFFIALKLYGSPNNCCLKNAALKAANIKELTRQAYRDILDVPPNDKNFANYYTQRKALLAQLGNPIDDVIDFCKVVLSREKNAIYYLTDSTQKEKELVFSLLDKYGSDYDRKELINVLKMVYPDLYHYLSAFRFKNELLNDYFQAYKYQKVINKVLPDFKTIVTEQAEKREYNLILEPRSSKTESIDRKDAQLYFMDAMGAEFLGFIMSMCKELDLIQRHRFLTLRA